MSATIRSAIERSRQAILDEIGDAQDVVFIRGLGNMGDELIWEGTRALLSERIYREVEFEAVCSASGELALLTGGGALCRPHHEWMTRALAIAALRFERVIVLPSSLDPSEDAVRRALAATRATVFAREEESYRRIRSLCDARLAHDCAFFFEFGPYRREGHGRLDVYRTDSEARSGRVPAPPGNDDISLTASSLQEWLEAIASHELIRTDRAHVMIAAAMMGKRVEYWPNSYHKLDAIAAYALGDLPVQRLEQPLGETRRVGPITHSADVTGSNGRDSRVTTLVVTRDRPAHVLQTIDSLDGNRTSLRTLVIDNNSAPAAADELAAGCAERPGVTLQRSDRNLGCAGGRWLGARYAETEFVLLLDDHAELEPGALDLLVDDLDAHPSAAGVSATVVLEDGRTEHSGGWMRVSRAAAEFGLLGAGEPPDRLSPSGVADWIPGTAALIRREALERFPIERRMQACGEDREWCYRVERARPGSFRRSLEARALHHLAPANGRPRDFTSRSAAVKRLETYATFYALHGKLMLVDLLEIVPELGGEASGSGRPDGAEGMAATRLLMELLLAKGGAWLLMEWMNGGLDPLLTSRARLADVQAEARTLKELLSHEQVELAELRNSHETLLRIYEGGWWRLRNRLQPALGLYQSLRKRGRS